MATTQQQSAVSSPLMRGAVILPALNEEAVIKTLVADIRAAVDWPVWLVDDCSSDRTVEVASQAGARVVELTNSLGAWGATQTGLRDAANRHLDFVVTMDADGQHDPGDIAALLDPVIAGHCDVVIGSAVERGSILRKFAWRLMRITSGLDCQDLTSGFRVLNAKAIHLLASPPASCFDYQDVGVLMMLDQAGMRIKEIPVTMTPRANGKSRVFSSWFKVATYMAQTLVLGTVKRRRPWRQ
jgi:glycosyltransferase involved in cell wall biosynthesis